MISSFFISGPAEDIDSVDALHKTYIGQEFCDSEAADHYTLLILLCLNPPDKIFQVATRNVLVRFSIALGSSGVLCCYGLVYAALGCAEILCITTTSATIASTA